MDLSREQLDKIVELLEWRRRVEVTDIYRHRVLTYGTDSDKIALELFERVGEIGRMS